MVTLVSALTGLGLMLGAVAGTVIAVSLGVRGSSLKVPVALAAGLGGILGVILGERVAHRFSGGPQSGKARIWAVSGGLAGLVGAVALAGLARFPFVPILSIMLPGIGAWIGDRAAQQGEPVDPQA